jgi:glycosyltransferase involved in cell wall biosynthesis
MITYSVYEYDNRVHRYGESLRTRGDEVDVICLGMAGDEESIADFHGVTLHKIQKREIDEKGPVSYLVKICRYFFKVFLRLTKMHLAKRYDVIHYNNIPDFGIFCTIIPKLTGARIIMDIHDLVPEFYMRKFHRDEGDFIIRLLRWIEKVSCRYAHHVITVTEMWKNILIHRSVSEEKCTVILNAPYPPLFDQNIDKLEKKKNSKPFTLLYHGALNEHFGVDIAIRAMSLVRLKVDNIQFIIVGNGRENGNLKKLTDALMLNGHVVFKEPVPRTEIPGLIRDADAGVVPKRSDKFADTALSSKLLEFAYMNKPVIVSRTTASQTYFDDSMVRFFEPENVEDLACSIVELIKDPKGRAALSRNVDKFNKTHHWDNYQFVYYSLLDTMLRSNRIGFSKFK